MAMTARPIRILHVVGGMNHGGIETWLMNVLRHIDRDRFQMDFVVHTDQHCVYEDEIRALGGRIIPCLHPGRPWLYAYRLVRLLREYGPYDIVHSHTYFFSGLILWLAARSHIPQRIAHSYPVQDTRSQTLIRRAYRRFMCRLIGKYATHLLFDSEAAQKAFHHFCAASNGREVVIYPVVDLQRFRHGVDVAEVRKRYGLPLELPVVVYVARFHPHKNHGGLLQMADVLNKEGKRIHLAMVGSRGPLLAEMKEIASQRDDATVLDTVEDVAPILLASDVFVFPSKQEGFGIVALEAQAAGLPCILSDAVPHEVDIVAPLIHRLSLQDPPAVWADAILASVKGVSLSQQESLTRIEQSPFNIKSNVAQLEHIYVTANRA
jgi:glycosyltransferase involved in cell wall biosynthesis